MSAGFILRTVLDMYPNSLGIYLSSVLFILLAPADFLAFNYHLYGRFVVNCIQRRHSLLRPERTAAYFVLSDFTTSVVQVHPLFPDTFVHFLMSLFFVFERRLWEVPFWAPPTPRQIKWVPT